MTSFTRKKHPNTVIGARYPNTVIWLVRDTYPYAAIWLMRDIYANAAIRPKHPNSLPHEHVGPNARKPEGAFKKGPAERSVKTAISRISFFPFCKPSPNTTKLELDLLTSEILARLERWSLMRLQNSTINNVVRDRLDNYVEKLAFPSCTLRRDVKMAADDRSVVLRIKRKRTEDPLDALREFISYTL